MLRTFQCLFFSLLLVIASSAIAQSLTPVPASQVSGDTFTASDGSFTVDAPKDWKWFRMPAQDPQVEQFVAIDPGNRISFLMTVTVDPERSEIVDEFMQGMGDGMERSAPQTGWNVTDYRFEKSSVPLKGAYRYSYTATNDAGTVKHRFGYIAGNAVKYNFLLSTTDEKESPEFKKFVSSFRLKSR